MIFLEFQYFRGCPSAQKMLDNVNAAIDGLEDNVNLELILVEDLETALKLLFRGSPTLLINGNDIEDYNAPLAPALTCRYYPNGLPSAELIRDKISIILNSKSF